MLWRICWHPFYWEVMFSLNCLTGFHCAYWLFTVWATLEKVRVVVGWSRTGCKYRWKCLVCQWQLTCMDSTVINWNLLTRSETHIKLFTVMKSNAFWTVQLERNTIRFLGCRKWFDFNQSTCCLKMLWIDNEHIYVFLLKTTFHILTIK